MIIQTLFGPEEVKKVCSTCIEEKPIEEFYTPSYVYDKDSMKRRSQCKNCWSLFNGRTKFSNVAMFEVK